MCCAKKKLAMLEREIAELKARLERLEASPQTEREVAPGITISGPDWDRIREMDGAHLRPFEDYK